MCNLYAMTKGRDEVTRLIRAMTDKNNNQPPMPGVYPDYPAPVVLRGETGAREMRDMRWGMPSSRKALLDAATKRADKLRAKGQMVDFGQLLKMEPDKGTTNIRNTASTSNQWFLLFEFDDQSAKPCPPQTVKTTDLRY